MKELTKTEQKKLGIRLPSKVKLFYTETDDSFEFSFRVDKAGKRKD
ncbi:MULTISPECIES: hypothetical protein [Vibrio]|nr:MULTISPECIES: hypothetical protein [Vibrio]